MLSGRVGCFSHLGRHIGKEDSARRTTTHRAHVVLVVDDEDRVAIASSLAEVVNGRTRVFLTMANHPPRYEVGGERNRHYQAE